MKTRLLALALLTFLLSINISGQTGVSKTDPTGNWKFEAPSADEGYNSGAILVGMAEQKHTVTLIFTGSEYKIAGEKVKFEKGILSFSVYLEGEEIMATLNMESGSKMTGKAVYSGGEVPLTLTKSVEKK
jgi:hypothetical protein